MNYTFHIQIDTKKQTVELMQSLGQGQGRAINVSYEGGRIKHGLEFVTDCIREVVRKENICKATFDESKN